MGTAVGAKLGAMVIGDAVGVAVRAALRGAALLKQPSAMGERKRSKKTQGAGVVPPAHRADGQDLPEKVAKKQKFQNHLVLLLRNAIAYPMYYQGFETGKTGSYCLTSLPVMVSVPLPATVSAPGFQGQAWRQAREMVLPYHLQTEQELDSVVVQGRAVSSVTGRDREPPQTGGGLCLVVDGSRVATVAMRSRRGHA